MDELSPEVKERLAEYGELIIDGRLVKAEPPEPPAKKSEKPSTTKEGE